MDGLEHEYEEPSNPSDHSKLVKAISNLDKTQHIQKPSRDGMSSIKSEFHTSHSHAKSSVAVSDIVNILQKTSEHADIGKKIKVVQNLSKTLEKPLEKHEAEKIKRATGFEEAKKGLDKWDPVVSRNRTLDHQKFPIDNSKVGRLKTDEYLSKFSLKSELELELNQLEPSLEHEEEGETFPMTMGELLEHRREMARLRAKQSYKEAKARRQGKIKSKKFHRIQRKEKIKQQLKEFEQLQKTNPEEALRKLEQLEKTRAQERVTLRHKSTGQWAKNKLVRAKYDKETRQQLAEQLAISRELTQKCNNDSSESDDEKDNDQNLADQDPTNPWLPKPEASKDIVDFVSGYRKYWHEVNKNQSIICNEDKIENLSDLTVAKVDNINSKGVDETPYDRDVSKSSGTEAKKPQTTLKKRKSDQIQSTTEWVVEEVQNIIKPTKVKKVETSNKSLDEMFDDAKWKLEKSVSNKINLLESDNTLKFNPIKSNKKKIKSESSKQNTRSLEFKKQKIRPEIDEELDEVSDLRSKPRGESENHTVTYEFQSNSDKTVVNGSDQVDPDKFIAIKPRHLNSTVPDINENGDHIDDDEDERKLTIAEAFEDDDIVEDFLRDKQNEINKDKPQVEDLNLPGWGSWVGKNMRNPKLRKRMILKAPDVISRKDDKNDNVFINENKNAKLKLHQVSELPFPFTSVSDYEASIRAPIGNTFIPESAHRKLIKPAVIVKNGMIIEPMDESQLVEKKKVIFKNYSNYNKPLFKNVKTNKILKKK